MARGIALNIGLNQVDPNHYQDEYGQPWIGQLYGCENDANAYAALADGLGYEFLGPVLTQSATTTEVIARIRSAATHLQSGDVFFLTYSGHGGQTENLNPFDDVEMDRLDETWCLHDRQFLDDEIYALLAEFRAGVRIVVFSDSCHSGTVTRVAKEAAEPRDEVLPRVLPLGVALATEAAHRDVYAGAQRAETTKAARAALQARVVLISACEDHETAGDGRGNGIFTTAMLQAWSDPEARSSYFRLWSAVKGLIPAGPNPQNPKYDRYGRGAEQFDVEPALVI
jgi:hypothetical protein